MLIRLRRYASVIAGSLCVILLCSSTDAETRDPAGGKKAATRPAFVTLLPPRRPADLTPLPVPAGKTQPAPEPEKPAMPSACLATFAERGGIALPSASENGSGACAIEDPITFRSIALVDGAKVELDSAVTVSCAFALQVLGWVRDDLPGIITKENGKLAKLVGVGGHACRPRNGMAGAAISEHATGNALDLSGFRLQDSRTVSLAGRDGATRLLRESLQKSACARFTTVLGPGSDSSHKDHLHLDMRKRPRDFKICQWVVE